MYDMASLFRPKLRQPSPVNILGRWLWLERSPTPTAATSSSPSASLVWAERSGAISHRPASPTEVRDVCGAGDTVFAALAVGRITGKSLREASPVARGAAGRQVAKVGIGAVG